MSTRSSTCALLVLVGDGEARRQPRLAGMVAQELEREAVERADEPAAERAADEALDAFGHLARRLVGERHRQDLVRLREAVASSPAIR